MQKTDSLPSVNTHNTENSGPHYPFPVRSIVYTVSALAMELLGTYSVMMQQYLLSIVFHAAAFNFMISAIQSYQWDCGKTEFEFSQTQNMAQETAKIWLKKAAERWYAPAVVAYVKQTGNDLMLEWVIREKKVKKAHAAPTPLAMRVCFNVCI